MLDQGKAGKGVVRIGVGLRWQIDGGRALPPELEECGGGVCWRRSSSGLFIAQMWRVLAREEVQGMILAGKKANVTPLVSEHLNTEHFT